MSLYMPEHHMLYILTLNSHYPLLRSSLLLTFTLVSCYECRWIMRKILNNKQYSTSRFTNTFMSCRQSSTSIHCICVHSSLRERASIATYDFPLSISLFYFIFLILCTKWHCWSWTTTLNIHLNATEWKEERLHKNVLVVLLTLSRKDVKDLFLFVTHAFVVSHVE